MDNIIRVSFKNNESEIQLHNDIESECKIIGHSAWMKLAASEKLQRDKYNKISNSHLQKVNTQSQIINSLDQLFANK